MDYLHFRELFHSSEIQREKAKLVSEFEVFNRDFFEDLPYRVRDVLDSLVWRFKQEEWFSEAWEKYRQHVLNAGLGGAIKMPGYVFKPYLERYVDEHPSQFNLSLDEAKCEAAYSDMEVGDYLEHYGIKDQKWGNRRYQNEDGTLTELGKVHYGVGTRSKRKMDFRKPNDISNDDKPESDDRSSNSSRSERKEQKLGEKETKKFTDAFEKATKKETDRIIKEQKQRDEEQAKADKKFEEKTKKVSNQTKKETEDFLNGFSGEKASSLSDKERAKKANEFINFFKKKEESPKEDKPKDAPKKDDKSKNTPKKDDKPKDTPKKEDKPKDAPKEDKPKDNKSNTAPAKDESSKKEAKKEIQSLHDTKDILNATGNLTESINKAIPKGQTTKIYAKYPNMTDQEIQREIKRISSERALSDLRGETKYIKSGQDKAKDILSGVSAGIGVATSALTLMILFKSLKTKKDSVETIDEIFGNYLEHHGVKGMKWGQRRYQNPDGTLTDLGKKHYQTDSDTPEGLERERVAKGTKDILDKTPKYDKTVRKQEKEYMKYSKKAGAKQGASTGMLIGGVAGATAAIIKNVYNDKYKKGSSFVASVAYGTLEGALGGAFIGSFLGKRAGKKSAQAHLANRGKEYTDKLLTIPVDRIDSR